ncbi:hypothetical protein ACIP93_37315 [Streptomyces sp. NPDC088745]|uniref:hypothetical protein n=1 Tax=Streptomyces sp. NPDC088745 TaxID=3365884 RepID=UPI00382F64D4
MLKSSLRRAVVAAVTLSALTVSCGADAKPDRPQAAASHAGAEGAATPSETSGKDEPSDPDDSSDESSGSSGTATPAPEAVRDAFAGLQATLDDSCADPGNCSYVLSRTYEELHGLDEAMKADPKGPGHFPEPLAWIRKLDAKLGGDLGFENLKKNQKLLISTRDRINTWMQGHPDDYR